MSTMNSKVTTWSPAVSKGEERGWQRSALDKTTRVILLGLQLLHVRARSSGEV
jgi:hypothetical protein